MLNWPTGEYWKHEVPHMCGRAPADISSISSAKHPRNNSLIFVTKMGEETRDSLRQCRDCLLCVNVAQRDLCAPLEAVHGMLYSDDPRYHFAEILSGLWSTESLRGSFSLDNDRGLWLGRNVKIDPSAVIEPGITIASDSAIGEDVYVMSGARLGPNVHIGRGSVVRENAVVGGYGFGFAMASGKPTIRMPHIGGVRIGRNVEIGALTTVCSGTIDPTIIEDFAKIDDHVHVAHNCRIAKDTIVTACAEISGSVTIGERTWLAPNCSIIDGVDIGKHSLIGIGAVVTKSVDENTIACGNPARAIRNRTPTGTDSEGGIE